MLNTHCHWDMLELWDHVTNMWHVGMRNPAYKYGRQSSLLSKSSPTRKLTSLLPTFFFIVSFTLHVFHPHKGHFVYICHCLSSLYSCFSTLGSEHAVHLFVEPYYVECTIVHCAYCTHHTPWSTHYHVSHTSVLCCIRYVYLLIFL